MTEPTASSNIDVPADLRVDCPKKPKGLLSAIESCRGCEHFNGMVDRFPGAKHLAFTQRYMVACRHPFGRAIYEIEK